MQTMHACSGSCTSISAVRRPRVESGSASAAAQAGGRRLDA